MRFEYIVLLIIAFNVITAVAQRRAKKARAEQAARSAGAGQGPHPSDAEWEDEDDDAEIERREREERQERQEQERRKGEHRRREAMESVASAPDEHRVEKMPSLGRDIFDQLARDLGLKIPRSEVPPARPEPGEPRPREARRPVRVTREPERTLHREELRAESPTAARTVAEKAHEKLATARVRSLEAPDLSAGARAPAPARPLPPVPHERAGAARPDLRDPRKLREAFIMKEILDAPVSRRPRR